MPVPVYSPPLVLKAPFGWAGGKSRQINEISKEFSIQYDDVARWLPKKFNVSRKYIEPFVGAGTVLINRLVAWKGQNVTFIAGDLNDGIINFWACLQSSPEDIIEILREPRYQFHNSKAESKKRNAYFAIRADFNTTMLHRNATEPLGTLQAPHRSLDFGFAANFLYLIKTSYGRIWSTNRTTGELNSGPGEPLKTLLVPELLRGLGMLLQSENVTFMLRSCFDTLKLATMGDVVYNDPPYDETNNTYVGGELTPAASFQTDLAIAFDECRRKGVAVYISNTNTSLIKQLFQPPYWESIPIDVSVRLGNTSSIQTHEVLILSRGWNQINPIDPRVQSVANRQKLKKERNASTRYNPYPLRSSSSSPSKNLRSAVVA